jgi:hypothetical protein
MEPEGIVDFQSANSVNGIHDQNFDDEVEAARNVDRGAIKYLGVDAAKPRLNFPIEDYTATSPIGRTVKDILSYT